MKILLSPAKRLQEEKALPTDRFSMPRFLETTWMVHEKLKTASRSELSELMGISPRLADLNFDRNQIFQKEHNPGNARPAMYLYDGDVYQGLKAYALPMGRIDLAQDSIRIISGLYGILKPLDLIQPYRLEMGTRLQVNGKKDLYQLWQDPITNSLMEELKPGELLVNLASNEYSKAVDFQRIKNKTVTPIFKDFKNGQFKVIFFFAKVARGAMTRFLIDHKARTEEDIKSFSWEGYSYSEKETTEENKPVFIR